MLKNKTKRIEVCGGIASGKTTLVKLLERSDLFFPIYENFQINPFWQPFYEDPLRFAFEAEITFTLQHYHELKKANTNKIIVTDYSFILDEAYAQLGLKSAKLQIYNDLVEEIYQDLSQADFIIFLKCDPKTELNRIRTRNRQVEQNVQLDFLTNLNVTIKKVFENKQFDNFLMINSEQFNFADNPKDQSYITQMIQEKILSLQ